MKSFIFLCCATVFSFTTNTINSQNAKIKIDEDKIVTVDQVFDMMMSQSDYTFIYQEGIFKDFPKVTLQKGTIKVKDLLKKIFKEGEFDFNVDSNNIVTVKNQFKARQRFLKGRVTDEEDTPLFGVTIFVKGTQRGTTTDLDGSYQLAVEPGETIVMSYLGFISAEFEIESQTILNVRLKEDTKNLQEVVLVGYGKITRERSTGAVTTVDTQVLKTTQNLSYADALIGVVPGLLVQEGFTNPDSSPKILLRGVGSINSSTSPLIVIDGIQMTDFNATTLTASDIESITILKDAASTSIYGSRGSNGVILITTKRGKRNSKLSVTVNSRVGILNPDKSFTDDIMNANQKLNFEESLGFYVGNEGLLAERRASGYDVNWSDLLLENGTNIDHDISISGGAENSNYYTSVSYSDVENMYGSKYKRYTANFSVDYDLTEKLTLAFAGRFGNVKNEDKRTSGSPFSNSFLLNPWEEVFDSNTGEALRTIAVGNGFSGVVFNPLFERANTLIGSTRKNVNGSVSLDYSVFNWLSLKGSLGANYNTSTSSNYKRVILGGGDLTHSNGESSGYTATFTANFKKQFNKHYVDVIVGNELNENESSSDYLRATGYLSDAIQTISAATNPPTVSDSKSHSGLLSYFSRVNYSFDNTYNLSVSYRRDGSSRFGENNKYANFWSVGGAWNIRNTFNLDPKGLSSLKLRASIGTSGNDFIGDFASQSLYGFRNQYLGSNVATLARAANPDLTWEKNKSTNIGLDFGLFNQRISGSLDYYVRTTEDLLNSVPLPLTSGFDNLISNIGNFRNTGLEVLLETQNIKNNSFNWTTSVNFATNKGEVLELTEDRDLILYGSIAYKKDSPINALYIVDWAGVNPDTGFNQYRDADNNLIDYNTSQFGGNRNEITALRTVTNKTSVPKYHGGITNSFTYKNFDASFLISFSGGNYVVNSGLHSLYNNVQLNQHVNIVNAWKAPGDQTDIAVRAINSFNPSRPMTSDFAQSSQFLQDASYVKLKNFIVGYTLSSTLTERIGLQKLRFFVQGQNLLTKTDVDYFDPEFATFQGGIGLSSSVNRGFSFGISAGF